MGYTALLFCPDEKTARTVTQVLSELEFAVEACCEPFAAVKKLMGQHFDAVVVDCDNEQNATLLFKSARNSASNQTSLAVAVVEGQAGVAKAFRIGANLVLTKPINIEQSKGTLRVARGLLRKSEPPKPAAPSAPPSSATTSTKPISSAPVAEPKTTAPVEPVPVFAAQPAEVPVVKPTPMWSAAAVASSKPAAQDDDLLDIDEEEPTAKPAPASTLTTVAIPAVSHAEAAAPAAIPSFSGPKPVLGSGAASAPAPARENKLAEKPTVGDGDDDVLETGGEPAQSAPAVVGSAPSFTFGGADAKGESSGAGKKIALGIAAAAIVAVGLYFGWTHLHGSTDQPVKPQVQLSTPAPAAPAPTPKPSAVQPAPEQPLAATAPSADNLAPAPSKEPSTAEAGENKTAVAETTKPSASSSKPVADDKPEPAPLMVTGGKAPVQKKAVAADTDAPSAIGLASGDAVPPPTFVPSSDATFKPTLERVNISQGVSQGLLIKKVPPTYPANAMRMRIEGKVELMATISKTGEIANIQVLSGDSQLTKAATAAVKQWKYKPYLLNGEPVEIQTQVTVNFKLPQ